MAASNKSHDGGVNKRDKASATERDKDRAVYADPDIRGVSKGRRPERDPVIQQERATSHRDLRGGR